MGALNATRAMGGCICLSICSAVLNSQRDEKLGFLPKPVLDGISLSPTSAIAGLPAEEARRTREAFLEIFRLQYVAIAAWGGAAMAVSLVLLFVKICPGGTGKK